MVCTATVSEVQKAFESNGTVIDSSEAEVLDKCVTLCKVHGISPDDLATKWDAFAVNNDVISPDLHHLTQFEHSIGKTKQRNKSKMFNKDSADELAGLNFLQAYKPDGSFESPAPVKKRDPVTPASGPTKRVRAVEQTQSPTVSSVSPSSTSGSPTNLYTNRNNSGQAAVPSVNDKIILREEDTDERLESETRRVQIKVLSDTLLGEKFMDANPSSRADMLEKDFQQKRDTLKQEYKLEEESRVDERMHDPTVVYGRLCKMSDGRFAAGNIGLVGGKELSGGARVSLDLKSIESYSLFPGQVVAVKGTNPTGRNFIASEILAAKCPKLSESSKSELKKLKGGVGAAPLTIVTCAGPYTLSANLDYDPLDDLLTNVEETVPDVLILCGPFVDANHPLIKSGELKETFLSVFKTKVIQTIRKRLNDLPTKVVLVPSLRDTEVLNIYPQPQFAHEELFGADLNADGRFMLVPNPCSLQVNEVVFGISTNDILFHLSSEETSNLQGKGDRMARLCSHLLAENSLYPLFPASATACTDVARMDKYSMPTTPDVLLLPSSTRYFAKVLPDNVVALNPGSLTKVNCAGTFSVLSIAPMDDSKLAGDEEACSHGVADRCRIDVTRI